ncbi:MAG: hypothetical protein ACOC6L_01920, partial [Thermodesulfobacteriota bacterium]
MGLNVSPPPEVIRPDLWDREATLPRLGLIPAGSLDPAEVLAVKGAEDIPVHLVFPVGNSREASNLRKLLAILWPLQGELVDRVWIAFGGRRLGGLAQLAREYPGLTVFRADRHLPPDQQNIPLGKGAAMRALLYHLIVREGLSNPRAVVEFLDADIRPPYFSPRWIIDPVGALLRFRRVEAAKVVYHRPRGGRLNAMLRSLLALCPHPGVQTLQQLAYLLSGEMAGTLHFWASLPFKSGFGVEILTLLSFALDRLDLDPESHDLDHLVQVHVGQMDHRHAPLTSTARRRGLDQMAGQVFHTFIEVLLRERILFWGEAAGETPTLNIPLPVAPGQGTPDWLQVSIGDHSLPPLKTLPEVEQR